MLLKGAVMSNLVDHSLTIVYFFSIFFFYLLILLFV